jgi:iron complex transport system ATP-binding protein
MELNNGNLYILLGKNGSGKSTLLRSICGQIQILNGSCQLNNNDIRNIQPQDLPKMISIVGSKLEATEFMTTYEYVALARTPYTNLLGRLTEQDLGKIDRAFDLMHANEFKERFINQLSDGERQLVAIAKAIAQETDIILLDEPTAFLDYSNKRLIMERLEMIAKEENKCIIISSHDLDICLNRNNEFLVVDQRNKELVKLPSDTNKEKLISLAY